MKFISHERLITTRAETEMSLSRLASLKSHYGKEDEKRQIKIHKKITLQWNFVDDIN